MTTNLTITERLCSVCQQCKRASERLVSLRLFSFLFLFQRPHQPPPSPHRYMLSSLFLSSFIITTVISIVTWGKDSRQRASKHACRQGQRERTKMDARCLLMPPWLSGAGTCPRKVDGVVFCCLLFCFFLSRGGGWEEMGVGWRPCLLMRSALSARERALVGGWVGLVGGRI
ncbi:hypothetical protein HDK77DRAFT_102141 [Phyllosticta capitalensis]